MWSRQGPVSIHRPLFFFLGLAGLYLEGFLEALWRELTSFSLLWNDSCARRTRSIFSSHLSGKMFRPGIGLLFGVGRLGFRDPRRDFDGPVRLCFGARQILDGVRQNWQWE